MPLAAGDIAVVAYNADGTDSFSFVALVDIAGGEAISFTDNGWLAAASFRSGEGTITWTAPAGGVTAGTVVTVDTTPAASVGTVIETSDLNFAAGGDQILAFQGSAASPTFLFALNNEGVEWQADATSSNTSALPTGLTDGVNAVAIAEIDNARYTGVTTGDRATLLAAITDPANWTGDDAVNQSPPASFTVTGGGGAPSLTVAIEEASISENGGASNATVTRTGSTVGELVVTLSSNDTSESTVPATVTILDGQASATFQVTAVDDPDRDGGQTVTIGASAAGHTDGSDTIVVLDDEVTLISEIQGNPADQGANGTPNNDGSPLVGQVVTVEAIVVGDFQGGSGTLRGFYVQEENADWDGDASTSEGLFIFDGAGILDVNEGDIVRVTGTVQEFFGNTQISATSVQIVQAGAVADVSTLAVDIALPAAGTSLSQAGVPQPDLEAYEGMLVRFTDTLTITEQFNLDRFNEIRLVQGDRPAQFTHDNAPDVAGYAAHLEALGARSIVYDDGLVSQNQPIDNLDGFAPYSTSTAPRMGDTVTGLTGVLDYQWAGASVSGATWRVRAIDDGDNTFVSGNPRPASPAEVGGTLKVASFNVLNFFATIDLAGVTTANGQDPRGADSIEEFDRQIEKLVNVILAMDVDVLGLVELENDFLAGAAGNAIETLVGALNTAAGALAYNWIDPGMRFVGNDAISVGYIYKPDTVTMAAGTTVEILDDSDPEAAALVGSSTVGGIFDGADTSRPAVAVTWQEVATGEVFTTVANHFKSKGGATVGNGVDNDNLDGAGGWNNQRLLAAQALADWIAGDPTGSGDSDVLVMGDLNAYFQEDPIEFLISRGYENLQETMTSGGYSYVFDGQYGSLDYILANTSMTMNGQITGLTEWHINADEADALDYNLDFGRDPAWFDASVPVRVSDHDPIIVGLSLNGGANTVTGTPFLDDFNTGGGDDRFLFTAADLNAGDTLIGGSGNDTLEIDGGGAASLLGVAIGGIESIQLLDAAGTTLTVADLGQAALVDMAAGAADTVIVDDINAPFTGDPVLAMLGVFAAGVETVKWSDAGQDLTVTALGDFGFQAVDSGGMLALRAIVAPSGLQSVTEYSGGAVSSRTLIDAGDIAPYQRLQTDYDPSGTIAYRLVVGDDGVETETVFANGLPSSQIITDTLDARPFQTQVVAFDAKGAVVSRLLTYDDGVTVQSLYTNGVLAQQTVDDVGDAWTYDTIVTTYDATGALDVRTVNNDDGTMTVTGGSGNNTLVAGAGNDLLRGGPGDDVFEFVGNIANDRVLDFGNGGDRLDLRDYGFDSRADLDTAGALSQVGANAVIDLGANGQITLVGFQIGNLGDAQLVSDPFVV